MRMWVAVTVAVMTAPKAGRAARRGVPHAGALMISSAVCRTGLRCRVCHCIDSLNRGSNNSGWRGSTKPFAASWHHAPLSGCSALLSGGLRARRFCLTGEEREESSLPIFLV